MKKIGLLWQVWLSIVWMSRSVSVTSWIHITDDFWLRNWFRSFLLHFLYYTLFFLISFYIWILAYTMLCFKVLCFTPLFLQSSLQLHCFPLLWALHPLAHRILLRQIHSKAHWITNVLIFIFFVFLYILIICPGCMRNFWIGMADRLS